MVGVGMGATHGGTVDARQDERSPMADHDAVRTDAGPDDAGARHQGGVGTARRPRARRARGVAVVLVTGGLSLASVGAFAQLFPVPDDLPGHLEVAAAPYPTGVTELVPGQSVSWQLEAHLADADASALDLHLHGTGALVEHLQGMEVAVESCPSAFAADRCPAGGATVLPRVRLAEVAGPRSGDTWSLPDLVNGEPQHLRVELGLPAGGSADATLQHLEGAVSVALHAAGSDPVVPETPAAPDTPEEPGTPQEPGTTPQDTPDEPATTAPGTPAGPGGDLPSTGVAVTGLLLLAAAATLLGAALRRAAAVRAPR